ncbi:MAG: S1/P1 nuclease [Gammaproteobacteria bacterium]
MHHVVAQIAYQQLTPITQQRVDYYLKATKIVYPQTSFTEVSGWADELRKEGVTAFNRWHYIDLPLVIDKPKASPHLYYASDNIVWAIQQCTRILRDPKTSDFQKGMFLRWLIHLVADIHQPLHNASLYSARFPHGDRGGNLYLVLESSKRQKDKITNLHALWDSGYKLPGTSVSLTRHIMQAYPARALQRQIKDTNPWHWARQGHRLAKRYAYQVPYNTHPSQQYIKNTRQVSQQQLALAGYRLAYVLNQIFAK